MMNKPAMQDPYLVKRGDTLGAIARASGKSESELVKLNQISNPNRLDIGQSLYLSPETAHGVSVLFLDALRHPIENLRYKIMHDGQLKAGKTGANGRVPRMTTADAASKVEVLVQDLQGEWLKVCETTSDLGHKLLTLVSGALVFKGATELHPKGAPAKPASDPQPGKPDTAGKQAALAKPAKGQASKNNPRLKTAKAKGKQGQSIIQIGVELPKGLLDHFAKYTGGAITEEIWEKIATELVCEPAVLKAIAEVESGGLSSFWRLKKSDGATVPAILFERHYFHKLTAGKYDADHPDISWPIPYQRREYLGKTYAKMRSGKIETTDIYTTYNGAYLRLINAYRLDPDAALKSVSWGKFQIMGDNFVLCGEKELVDFVDKMCSSEEKQMGLFASFIKNKPAAWKNKRDKKLGKEISLWDAIKTKNWAAIAFNFNGPTYSKAHYDIKLKAAYDKHKKS